MRDNNEKNIYDMLNDIEIDLSEYERDDFNDIEKMKVKKKFRTSIGKKKSGTNYKKYASVASIGIISLVIISATPLGTYASKIISDLVWDIKGALRIENDDDNYIKIINKSIEKDDMTLRLNEAILNNGELIISLTTIAKEKIPNNVRIYREEESKVYINGEFLNTVQTGTLSKVSDKNLDEVMFLKLDAQKYTGIIDVKLDLGDITIFKLDKNENLVEDHIVKGPFIFEFKFDTTKINTNTKEVDLDEKIELDDGTIITLDNYVQTPLTQKIYYIKNNTNIDRNTQVILKGKDDLGNDVSFEVYYEHNGEGELVANTRGEKVRGSAKYITLNAYQRIYKQDSGQLKEELKLIKKDIKINLGK